MKKKISTYVVLTIALVGCVAGMVFLGLNLFTDKTIKMQNFENMTKEQVFEWATKNKVSEYITYTYEYSENVEEGSVISQSIEPNAAVNDNFTVCISKGSIIDINVNDYKTRKEFEDFIAQYPKVKVDYVSDEIFNENSELTKFSKNQIDIKNDQLTVFLSLDRVENKSEEEKETEKEDNKKDGKVLIPDNLLGMEEDKFIAKLNELGFKNLKKNSEKFYSFTSKKDTIYSYDDGRFDTNKTINYAISLGDYPISFDAKEYNGLAKDKVDALVKKYNALNAHITLNVKEVETKDTKLVNTVANCKCTKNGTKSIINCDLYIKEIATVNVPSYAGKTEAEMQKALKALGFNSFNKTGSKYSTYAAGTIYSNDTGDKKTNETINYVLSLGSYVPNVNDFNGKTLNDAKNVANNYNNQGANVQIANPVSEDDNSHPNNTLYDCSSTSTSPFIITCKIAVNYSKYDLLSESMIIQNYFTSSYDGTVAKLNELFGGKFTNVTYRGVENSLGVGEIVNVIVDGQDVYNAGKYDSKTPIIIEICNKQRN